MDYELMIKKFAERISENKKINGIYVFGSYLNNFRISSDIDICIIGKLNKSEKNKILRESPEKLDINFFNELPIFIRVRIFKEGRELFSRDNEELENIKLSTLKEYRDFMFFMKTRISGVFENV